ncbi:MAG: hypothetical protein ACYC8T_29580 [Myxococcaceae bacterium]
MPTLLALLLLAAPVLPFPAPKAVQVTDELKYATGTILTVAADGASIVVTTPAGPATFLTEGVQVIAKDGAAAGGGSALQAGQAVRIYFILSDGPKAREIDFT